MATYLVTQPNAPKGTKPVMVEARTKQQAIGHVARDQFDATALSTKEALSWAKQGVDFIDLSAEAEAVEGSDNAEPAEAV